LSTIVAWVYSSYFNGDFASLLVYFGQDGNCDNLTQGLGVHCFGDYSAIHFANLFQVPQGAEVVYPLITRVFRLPFLAIESVSSYRIGLGFYLVALLMAILFPLLHLKYREKRNLALGPLLCIAILNVGTISSLDRGNVIAFTVPFLYLFLIRFQNNDSRIASTYLTIAAMVKPQLALFAVVFLWRSEIKTFVVFAARTAFLLIAPYLVFGSKSLSVFSDWIEETLRWSKSLPSTANFPTNYSFNRVLGSFGIEYPLFSYLWGLFFLIAISTPIVMRKRKITSSDLVKIGLVVMCVNAIVYGYYTVLLLPYWVVLLRESDVDHRIQKETNRENRSLYILLAIATAPVAWPSRWRIGDTVGAEVAFNMIPIIVTFTTFGYLISNAISSLLVSFNPRDSELK